MWENEVLEADTISTPDFLGLSGASGVWTKQFGGQSHAGEGVIIGVIDSGFWPENPQLRTRCPSRVPTPTRSPRSGRRVRGG